MKTLTARLDTANKFVETVHSQILDLVPLDLKDQLEALRRFSESIGQAVLSQHSGGEVAAKKRRGSMRGSVDGSNSARRPSFSTQEAITRVIREQLEEWAKSSGIVPAAPPSAGKAPSDSGSNSRSASLMVSPAKRASVAASRPGSNNESSAARQEYEKVQEEVSDGYHSEVADVRGHQYQSMDGHGESYPYSARPVSREVQYVTDKAVTDEMDRIKEILANYKRSSISKDDIIAMLSPTVHTGEGDFPPAAQSLYKSLLIQFIEAEVEKMIVSKVDRDELMNFFQVHQAASMQRESEKLEKMIKEHFAKFDRDTQERNSKTDTKFRNLTKMLREVEASVARAGAPAEHVTVTEDWKPELTKYAEQLAKSEEENKALVNKVSSIPVLIPINHPPTCPPASLLHILMPSLPPSVHIIIVCR